MGRARQGPSRPRIPWRSRRRTFAVLAVVIVIAVRVWQDRGQPDPPESLPEGDYAVARVVDGDTLLLENDARVRLIGVDSPESVKPNHPVEPFGPLLADPSLNANLIPILLRHDTLLLTSAGLSISILV